MKKEEYNYLYNQLKSDGLNNKEIIKRINALESQIRTTKKEIRDSYDIEDTFKKMFKRLKNNH